MKNLIFPLFLVCIFFSLPSRGQGITGSGDPAGPGSMPYYDCENNCIEIMFDESSRVRLREGIPVDLRTDALKGVNEVLGTLAWHQWQRICDVPEETVDSWQENGERNTGKPVYNLNNIYRLHIPETEGIWKFCEEMEALPGVYMARPVPKPVVAPLPGNYQPQQVYEDPVSTGPPTGIDAEYAWTQTGGTGSGITVCDLEYSWNYNHADVTKGPGSALNSWTDPFSNTNHGTAVIGEMVSDNNGWGTTGICYNSGLLTCGTYYGSPAYWNVPGAIALAIAALQPGDIILLEQQWDYTGNAGYVPIEWWNNYSPSAQTNNAVYAAIVNAISNGIHVVEAGGNGNVNTGSMTWYGDSGAIIVGAGGATASNDLTRLSFSSYGPRFNLQGWGEKVVTTGYGDLYSSQGVNYYYTSTFSGTSSASPIVAGAVACLSGYWLANISTIPPTPAFVRSHLATYGTPQVTPPSGNIGPRPDLGNAIPNIPPQTYYDWGDAPDPTYPTLATSNGANHPLDGITFMGALVDPEGNGLPHPQALGDDLNNLADEDGVTFLTPLSPGSTANIQVVASVQGFLSAWIDFNANGTWGDPGEQIFNTAALAAGTNNLSFPVPFTAPPGAQTFARFRFINVPIALPFYSQGPSGEVEDYMVIIEESQKDWGDAPDAPYPTLAASNGANHQIDWVTYLGNQVDPEPDGQPDPQALGDDNDIIYPPPNDDEDGVVFTTPLYPGQPATVQVTASAQGYLNTWIDFNMNGSWADPGEQVFVDFLIGPGTIFLNFAVPSPNPSGQTYARFRFCTMQGLTFTGGAPDGEVEDYEVWIEEGDQFDWGDAPDAPYPTLAGSNGANHKIDWVTFLGGQIDAEPDGQPDPNALGDDNNGAPDEDGVVFNGPFSPGMTTSITVFANVPGVLNAWFDFNMNGSWADPGEHVFVDVTLASGGNNLLVPVPAGIGFGQSFARFRFSNFTGLTFTGTASNGEVEDYEFWIEQGGTDGEFGDAPEGSLGYPGLGVMGQFPTCSNVPVSGWVQHMNYGAWMGPQIDFETEGNAGFCPLFNPNTYDMDECQQDGDAGLLFPDSYTITGAIGSETVIPCPGAIGVTFLTGPCQSVVWGINMDIDLHNHIPTGSQAYLNIVIDWDQNGSWGGSVQCPGIIQPIPEHVLVDFPVPIPWDGPASALVPPVFMAGPNTGYLWMRITISDLPVGTGWDGSGVFDYGESEDFLIAVGTANLDWGDAPDPSYPTLAVSLGASHVVDGITFLGNSVDAEMDGQPDINSLGDDNDGNDDDDGVIWTNYLYPGITTNVKVTASVPGFLSAWFDFNDNGSWADAGEQIFTDVNLPAGSTTLSFTIPASAVPGITYTRFRFSTIQGLSYTGQAPDGEVEDYRVGILQPGGDGIIVPDPNLALVQNEISMALLPGVTPGVPAVLLAAYNDHPFPGGPGLGVSYSNDGGLTWNPQNLPYPFNPFGGVPFVDAFDPTATADGNGDLYAAHISTDYNWGTGPVSGLFVHKSTTGGATWTGPYTVAIDGPPSGSPDPNYRFNDRCQITADINPASPYYNNLYIVWIKDRGWNMPLPYGDIYFSSSTNGGLTWSPAVTINQTTNNMGNMPVPAVAPDGTLYVCWVDYNVLTGGVGTIFLDYSTNGGNTWLSTDILVRTVNLPPINLNGGTDARAKGAAVIQVSPFNPQQIYITYAEMIVGTPDEADIFFIQSPDAGLTWTNPLRVNDDLTTCDQVMPWMDIKPNGTIDIAWYDRRNDAADLFWDVYIATSTNSGTSFSPNVMLNDISYNTPATIVGPWMGEYLGLVVDATHAYIGFTSSVPDINGDILFDRYENPEPEIDFGDAPDPPYPTLFASNGARHIIDGVTFMGGGVDSDPDGQPDPNALGDDNDGNDDEDGVVLPAKLYPGGTAAIQVTVSVTGYFNGWIDYNLNGSWGDPGEQVFTDALLPAGVNSMVLNVPSSATLGISFARFRFSTVQGLGITGQASDGEVEDYEVEIAYPPKWEQLPNPNLPGLHAHDWMQPPQTGIVLADDWKCGGGWVTDLHWWGNYELDINNQEIRGAGISHFHLSIHSNSTATCLPLDPEVWGADVPFSSLVEQNTGMVNIEGCPIYLYEYFLTVPFPQIEGNYYWLDITAVSNDPTNPPHWRWQESARSTTPTLCGAANKTIPTPNTWSTIFFPNNVQVDLAFVITSEPMGFDMGDAPDPPYPTLLASSGAAHLLDGVTWLGGGVDSDPDGQPDPNALGDDNDGNDDEDGVLLPNKLYTGGTANVQVTVSVTGYFNGWIDYNLNGSWGDPGEQVFTDALLPAGVNSMVLNVPSSATLGISFARFRFSTVQGIGITGQAPDGEVEDYEIEIAYPPKWEQLPNPNLPGLHAHDWVQPPQLGIILADDWKCGGGWVTDLHWWGNYELDLYNQEIRGAGISHFHLSIHSNSAAACLPLDPEVWGADVPFSSLVEQNTGMVNLEGSPIYLYEYFLTVPFPQIEGNYYWLDITAVSNDPTNPPHWRWQESARSVTPILCGAANKTVPTPNTWSTIVFANDFKVDLAFRITSEPVSFDMGDAPDPPYPTLLASNGAAHLLDGVTWLGGGVDSDPDGQPDPNALGDDNDGNDDEDGVTVFAPLIPGSTSAFTIIASVNGILNAWIDFNANGSWAEAGEQIFTDAALSAGSNLMFFGVPSGALVGHTFARFRFSTVQGLTFTGVAPDGEVEDYKIHIEGELDFGDAPDPPYPTLLVNNGARHIIDYTIYLGAGIDADPDGQPDPNSLGDDNDGNDDEDGVTLPAVMAPGQNVNITVVASANGFFNGWIDFDGNGSWADAGEQVFTDAGLAPGTNTLTFTVPAGAVLGVTHSRFRYCTFQGLTFTGQAPDGEVEDYEVVIDLPYKWMQQPDLSDFGLDVDATWDMQNYLPPHILADDFRCTITGPLTDIFVWGSWYHDHIPFLSDPGGVIFTLSIHRDIPDSVSGTGYSMPGDVIWFRTFHPGEFMVMLHAGNLYEGWYDPFLPLYEPYGDSQCWLYHFPLQPGEFIQQGTPDIPVVYWLDVQAQPLDADPECRFGWKTSLDHWNDDAVWTIGNEPYFGPWNELTYPQGHPMWPESIDLAFAIMGTEDPFILVDLTAFLEGPFNGTDMDTDLNANNVLPNVQPYGSNPSARWYYTGGELVPVIPNSDVVDWIEIELRDAPGGPVTATGATMIAQKASFVLKNGKIVALDGASMPKFYVSITSNLYVVLWHRNHLGILSSAALTPTGNIYSWNFSTGSGQAYGGANGHKNLGGTGIWGMMGGDGKPDEEINNGDKIEVWAVQAGTGGYKEGDFNMDVQVNNGDKNEVWVPNVGKGSQVPL